MLHQGPWEWDVTFGMRMERDRLLLDTFVELAGTLVNDYDVMDLLHTLCRRCHDVLEVDAVGVLLAGEGQRLALSAASTDLMEELELFELQQQEGPCVDAFRSGESVVEPELADAVGHWPTFAPRALACDFHSVFAFPLRLRAQRIGALNMFRHRSGHFDDLEQRIAQSLAHVATISIVQDRALREAESVTRQLQLALDSRVLIEQAKGVVAARLGVDVTEAFQRLRREARESNRKLRSVCQDVVDGRLRFDANTAGRPVPDAAG